MNCLNHITLTSNGHLVSNNELQIGYLQPSSFNSSVESLKRQYFEEGYIYIPKFFDEKHIREIRAKFFGEFTRYGFSQHEAVFESDKFLGANISLENINQTINWLRVLSLE